MAVFFSRDTKKVNNEDIPMAWKMENIMSEISLQAMQFVPRFVGVMILMALTWLVASFAKYMVKRATCGCAEHGEVSGVSKILSGFAFWSVFVLMAPFILDATGINAAWFSFAQRLEGQIFANWPVWMILGLVVAGFGFVVQGIPKLFVQLRSQGEVQS